MTVTISSQAKDRLLGKISREFGDDKRKKNHSGTSIYCTMSWSMEKIVNFGTIPLHIYKFFPQVLAHCVVAVAFSIFFSLVLNMDMPLP